MCIYINTENWPEYSFKHSNMSNFIIILQRIEFAVHGIASFVATVLESNGFLVYRIKPICMWRFFLPNFLV